MQTLSFGIVEGEAVFMDARSDTYFMLDPVERDGLLALLQGGTAPARDLQLRTALALGDDGTRIFQADPSRAALSLMEDGSIRRAKIIDIIGVAAVLLSTRARLRQPVEEVLASALAHKGTHKSRPSREVVARASRFIEARKFVPMGANCLLDSLALLAWLGDPCAQLALIFGVKLHPFAAHCWVQLGELILNDRLESVAPFTPVRVIRCPAATH